MLAAAALEAGLAPEYDCNGAVVVDGQIFRCAGGVPHGEVDLSAALAKSCNGYFIRLGQQLGAQALLQQAQALGFGRSIGLAEGLTAQSGACREPRNWPRAGSWPISASGRAACWQRRCKWPP